MLTPSSVLYTSLAARIASDPAKLGLATFLAVTPILAPYAPSVSLLIGALTLGTGTLAKLATTLVTSSGLDAVSGQYKILVPPPAGGWTWNYDGATPAAPQTIYGYALVDAATGGILMAVTPPLTPPLLLAGPALVVNDEMSFLMLIPPIS